MSSIYVFKSIPTLLKAEDLVNYVLSKTQRKTPTEVHPGYQIQRIRAFYLRKVKFAAEAFKEKLEESLNGFPKLNDIHPFFADWLNVLYDKDHYKIALGQLHATNQIIDRIAQDYLKLLKFSDSLYRCKTLKIAALGRMCSVVKKLKPALDYLEEVRRHVARLPSIDPFSPSILLFGFPNVGKSSFMTKVTRADVEVSPIPFSTQSLYLGHLEYSNVKVQVIDSPGVLNRPLEQRNTIEMQSIIALANLRALIMFMVDVSETCGHSLEEQLNLFQSLKPLFAKRPVVVIFNKWDLVPAEGLDAESLGLIEQFKQNHSEVIIQQMSCLDDDAIRAVRANVCQRLLDFRIGGTGAATSLKTDEDYYKGVRVVEPTKTRNRPRPTPQIPASVIAERQTGEKEPRISVKELQDQQGGAGVYAFPLQEHFLLENPNWKYDIAPEIINGMNVWDYVDPDIEKKLLELEAEEEERLGVIEPEAVVDDEEIEDEEELKQVRKRRKIIQNEAKIRVNEKIKRVRKLDMEEVKEKLNKQGLNNQKFARRADEVKQSLAERRAARDNKMEMEEEPTRSRSTAHTRSPSQRAEYFKPTHQAEVKRRKIQKISLKNGQAGDADRHVYSWKPKHLFSGKRGIGKADRR